MSYRMWDEEPTRRIRALEDPEEHEHSVVTRRAEYAAARNFYSRSRTVAGPDGFVLATRERGLQVEPAFIHGACKETV